MWIPNHLVCISSLILIASSGATLSEYLLLPCFTTQNPYLYPPQSRVEMKMNIPDFDVINDDPPTIEVEW